MDAAPDNCSKELYENGEGICYLDCPMYLMEGIVRETRRSVDNPDIDWHYVGGRAVVRILRKADTEKVLQALKGVLERAKTIHMCIL